MGSSFAITQSIRTECLLEQRGYCALGSGIQNMVYITTPTTSAFRSKLTTAPYHDKALLHRLVQSCTSNEGNGPPDGADGASEALDRQAP